MLLHILYTSLSTRSISPTLTGPRRIIRHIGQAMVGEEYTL